MEVCGYMNNNLQYIARESLLSHPRGHNTLTNTRLQSISVMRAFPSRLQLSDTFCIASGCSECPIISAQNGPLHKYAIQLNIMFKTLCETLWAICVISGGGTIVCRLLQRNAVSRCPFTSLCFCVLQYSHTYCSLVVVNSIVNLLDCTLQVRQIACLRLIYQLFLLSKIYLYNSRVKGNPIL